MILTKRGILLGAVACAAVATLSEHAIGQQGQPFKIGASLAMTGPFAQYGELTERALRVGIKQVNARGGILGRPVELIVRDDAGNPGRALLAVKELVEDQKVDFLYPETLSGLVVAVLPYATEKKMVTFSVGAAPEIGDTARFPYSFQLSDLATKRVPAVATAIKKLGGTKAGILVSTNPGTVALGEGLANILPKEFGVQVAGFHKFASDAKDFVPLLQNLRDAGADIIAFDGVARDSIRIVMMGMQSIGWKAKVVAEPAIVTGDIEEQIPAEVRGQFYSVAYRVSTRSKDGIPGPIKEFIDELRTFGPIVNLGLSISARDIVFMVKWANETAQKEKSNTSPDSLKAVLENIANVSYPADYSLMIGNPRYTAKDHTTNNADYSKMWGLIHTSPVIDGTYEGEPLDVKN